MSRPSGGSPEQEIENINLELRRVWARNEAFGAVCMVVLLGAWRVDAISEGGKRKHTENRSLENI